MDEVPSFFKQINSICICPCGYYTSDVDDISSHMSFQIKPFCNNGIGYENEKYKCVCGKLFDSFDEIEEHHKLKRSNCAVNYMIFMKTRCKTCNITFECKYDLERHKTTKTHLEKEAGTFKDISLYCNVCDIRCLSKALMEKHLQTNKHKHKSENIDPLFCKTCDIRCLSKALMEKHLQTKKHRMRVTTNAIQNKEDISVPTQVLENIL